MSLPPAQPSGSPTREAEPFRLYWATPRVAQRCPVCEGRGQMPQGFYQSYGSQWTTSSLGAVPCRSCNGLGFVWSP